MILVSPGWMEECDWFFLFHPCATVGYGQRKWPAAKRARAISGFPESTKRCGTRSSPGQQVTREGRATPRVRSHRTSSRSAVSFFFCCCSCSRRLRLRLRRGSCPTSLHPLPSIPSPTVDYFFMKHDRNLERQAAWSTAFQSRCTLAFFFPDVRNAR